MRRENYITAIKIAIVIGIVLNLINSYDAIFSNEWSVKLILKIILTFSVPYFVSIYSSWKVTKSK